MLLITPSQRPSYFDCYFSFCKHRCGIPSLQMFEPPRSSKSSIFIQNDVVVFEVFAVFICDVTFVVFLWRLGASWGSLGPPLGGSWQPSGASWPCLGGPSGTSLGILEGFLAAKAPKMPPRIPKTPPGGLPDPPGGLPEAPPKASRRPPRGP